MRRSIRLFLGLAAPALAILARAPDAHAVGESVNGFPAWSERVIHEWMNRARSDPQVEMATCGASCGDAPCYAPIAPLAYSEALNHAARFHAAEMAKQGYFAHDSHCGVVPSIATTYPGTCDGATSCACVGGTETCPCTTWSQRVGLFGAQPSGEIIAGGSDPNSAFYLWLFESYPTPMSGASCSYVQGPPTNGHRWNILRSNGTVGVGVANDAVGDFSGAAGAASKIASGSHYPRQAASVDVWASFADAQGPKSALVDVDGTCTPMTRQRGVDTNGAWTAAISGVGSGCHRYFFRFTDSAGNLVTYPTTGSLGIGPDDATCADWDTSRPATGAGCNCAPSCGGKTCGDDGCGGACGNCVAGKTCQGGQCVGPTGGDAGPGADGGGSSPDAGGASDSGAITTRPDATAGGDSGSNNATGDTSSGCSCRAAGRDASPAAALGALAVLGLVLRRRASAPTTSRRGKRG